MAIGSEGAAARGTLIGDRAPDHARPASPEPRELGSVVTQREALHARGSGWL